MASEISRYLFVLDAYVMVTSGAFLLWALPLSFVNFSQKKLLKIPIYVWSGIVSSLITLLNTKISL